MMWACFSSARVEFGMISLECLLMCIAAASSITRPSTPLVLKTLLVTFLRFFFAILRLYGEARRGLQANTERRMGWFLTICAIGYFVEVTFLNFLTGHYVALVVGFLLCLSGVTMPRGETFFLERNGYFYGTTWPFILAVTLWRLGFDAAHHLSGPDGSLEIFLARACDATADFLIACTFHPAKWLHARALSEGLYISIFWISDGRPLTLEWSPAVTLGWTTHVVLDVTPNLLAAACLAWHVYASRCGGPQRRAALLQPFAASLYADRYRPQGASRADCPTGGPALEKNKDLEEVSGQSDVSASPA
eukprot:CAMPEP_0198517016 /NCGR_PEP_ID=MMETSP1462-20131121/18266_1 /TAXON_ID=1333877 /ORGANISM="Brandtodinium nutriculum, Strain RCC3387" /LENGTH=305 /DNA_ID=CAMNT_0044246563 /DNA_START=1 /DNA_END=918 /DNA_ORIENTATION=-